MTDETQDKPNNKPAKAIVLAGERGLQFRTLDEMYRFCVACAASKEFKDIETPEQALIRLQAGLELGLSPIWSLTNIMVVNGRPSVWGDAALGIVQAHPDFEDAIEEYTGEQDTDDFGCVCVIHRKGREPKTGRFTVGDAKRAHLWNKPGPWQSYPKRMLQMRARTFALRDQFADALRGLGVIEEMRDAELINGRKHNDVKPMILPDEVPADTGHKPISAVPVPAEQETVEVRHNKTSMESREAPEASTSVVSPKSSGGGGKHLPAETTEAAPEPESSNAPVAPAEEALSTPAQKPKRKPRTKPKPESEFPF